MTRDRHSSQNRVAYHASHSKSRARIECYSSHSPQNVGAKFMHLLRFKHTCNPGNLISRRCCKIASQIVCPKIARFLTAQLYILQKRVNACYLLTSGQSNYISTIIYLIYRPREARLIKDSNQFEIFIRMMCNKT